MDETNPTDITANRATGTNPAPVPPETLPPQPTPAPVAPPPQPSQPAFQSVPPAQLETQSVPVPQIAASDAGEKPVLQVTNEPVKKPLREDIARVIDKIKLPERIAVKMSGEYPKPPAPLPPPATPPPAPAKEAESAAAPKPPVESVQTPPGDEGAQKEAPSSVASVHTLKDDLQTIVRDKKMSLVRAVALESEKKKGQEHLAGPHSLSDKARSHKIIGIAFVAMVFAALGLVAFWGVRSVLRQSADDARPTAAPSLMFAEATIAFPQETRTGVDLKRTLAAGVRSVPNISLGAVLHIVPTSSQTNASGAATEQAMGIGDFLNAMDAQATPELIRSFRGDFFLGFHQTAGKLSPVLIIPVTSYERAFAGMLAWEPFVNADLTPIFTSIPPQTVDEKGLFVERQFQDALINNYDVRFIKDDSGAAQLLYSFPTRTMLIIAESPYSFTEVLSRLRASRQL